VVQTLVDGIARSGLWLEGRKPYREYAAEFVGRYYFHQPPALLKWALTRPIDRVMYAPLSPRKPDFDFVRDLMMESGVLDKRIEFDEYVDVRFAEHSQIQTAWKFEPGAELQ
jgi:NitT/TauT family transport system substrate-binding protein